MIGLALLAVVVIGALVYFLAGRSTYDKEMADAVSMMSGGRTEAARTAFSKITREHPDKADPHVFLSRLARDDGDATTARQELVTAIRLDAGDEKAQREMGILLLAQNSDPDLARRFLARAVTLNMTDSAAQGYLGCALLRLNRIQEGEKFLSHAGTGVWSSCSAVPSAAAAPPIR